MRPCKRRVREDEGRMKEEEGGGDKRVERWEMPRRHKGRSQSRKRGGRGGAEARSVHHMGLPRNRRGP